MRIGSLVLAFACGAIVSACGQQGPLYLPDKSQDAVSAPAQQPDQQPVNDAGGAPGAATPPAVDPSQDNTPRTGRDPNRNSESR